MPDGPLPWSNDAGGPYPVIGPQADLPELEEAVLAWWEEDGTFKASVEARPGGANEYVFYDGPPFANGLPHYGHLLTGFVKDAIPRYQTMRGRRVERRFGWDCHGLPAEVETEKELHIHGRAAIADFGIGRFNDHCRSLVQRTTGEWRRYVRRQARWVDFDNEYRTMDLDYMESVMWAFKRLYELGLAYEGYKVLPYCWECETPLSNSETRMDDAYRPRTDTAVTVAFDLHPARAGDGAGGPGPGGSDAAQGALRALVWTTTPWTLPSNLALAVGPDLDYEVHVVGGRPTLIGAGLARDLLEGSEPVARLKGADLLGRTYEPLFPFFATHPRAFTVLAGSFVSTDEGTGIVHIAPGFGEDDQRLCQENGIDVVAPVDDQGRFTAEVPAYAGLQVFDANPRIVEDLRRSGALVAEESYTHSYPHCWRTDTPLIYRAVSSWFVKVSALKERMAELNREITWIPDHVRDGAFGKGIESAPDWPISRNRFWGAPIPVWSSDDPAYPRLDVYGSLDEIEADFGVRPADLHRPAIDELTRPNPDDPTGRSTMRRVPDVLDCWFESGSMPYAQLHYPFEQTERFESHFPADFIVEYMAQTRGWFYTLHVLGTALFDRPPFKACLAHGVVLGDDGRKLSKRLKNFPDPDEAFSTYGADAIRWFMLSSGVLRGGNIVIELSGMLDAVRQAINPIWSAWYFLSLYGNADAMGGAWRTDASGVLDRYILAKLAALVSDVQSAMDAYDLYGACAAVTSFLDALTNWYIRRSRDRFWRAATAGDQDKADAYDTLSTVLEVLCRVAAPLLPMLTEAVWKGLTGGRSVHLADWPDAAALPADEQLVVSMDRAREVCSAAHSVRKAQGIRARMPLGLLTVAAPWAEQLAPYVELIAEEVNVKRVRLSTDLASAAELHLAVNPSVLGPRLGPDTQRVIAAVKAGEWSRDDGVVTVAGRFRLEPGEHTLRLRPRDERSGRALAGLDAVVTLDTTVTPELEAEGLARDMVREIQVARRAAGLHVADRVAVVLALPGGPGGPLGKAAAAHRAWIGEQTLANSLDISEDAPDKIEVRLTRA